MRRGVVLKTAAASAMALTMGACAHRDPPLYYWGGYQDELYGYFKASDTNADDRLRTLQAQAERARGDGKALPPGFRAHLGLLHLQSGRPDEARRQFEAEKLAFPESKPYMDFLLKRMTSPKT